MASELIFFLGGARSGKSRLAQAEAERGPAPLRFIATAQALDAEMAERIARHQADRGPGWHTIEAPSDVAGAIARAGGGTVLVDCLTLWLTNVMLADAPIDAANERLLAAIAASPARLILVANEVGLGIVPTTPLGRRFRDAAGRLNQRIAERADRAWFVVAGRRLPLA